ncbi:MAG: 50S ribosomal protein L5 [Candidatus Poribacteria bacterium]|nr:MAG: 50S ribosomal protein L5 [Candidatus Poribacteria bacterium]
MYRDYYQQEVVPALRQRFGYKNPMQVPKLEKIVVTMGVGSPTVPGNAERLDAVIEDLAKITGQRPAICRAKKSVSNFKVRAGMPIGCRVTLRGERMYEFFHKLVKVVLPQIRDFRGVNPNSFDGRGNFALGLSEQIIFPELDYDDIRFTQGMHIVIVTTAKTDEEARELLRLMGMPFRETAAAAASA